MSRTVIKIHRGTLEQAINKAEESGPLKNQSMLWKASEAIYNKSKPADYPTISFSVIVLRVAEWKISVKTPKGKRGRQKGMALPEGFGGSRVRGNRKEKFAKNPRTVQCLKALKEYFGTSEPARVEKLAQGSATAGIALKCIDCLGGCKSDIRNCGSYKNPLPCPLYPFRPFQKAPLTVNGVEVEVDDEASQEAA